MRSFASDNNSGVHPAIMDAIVKANKDHAIAYGDDKWTKQASEQLKAVFGNDVELCFVFNGTGSNMVALQTMVRPFHSIITASTGHINVDECGAPSKFTGCMVKEIPVTDGKLTPALIAARLHGFGDQHHSQPKVIYISQTTELGTVYTPQEIKDICELAHQHDMYVHMDGSRLANACASLNLGLKELSRDCGIDILSLGGTKNGMLMGEAVIAFRPELAENLRFYRKQSAQLFSKMRYLSAQFPAYFDNNLWFENALNANKMANKLAAALQQFRSIIITQKVESNAIFLIMPPEVIHKLRLHYFFYTWDETRHEVRFVCSWDTTEADIDGLIAILDEIMD